MTEPKIKENRNIKIIKGIIECCSDSLATDVMSSGLMCVHCNKEQPATKIDIWQPIGRSDTYMIRNTLQSMLDADLFKSPPEVETKTSDYDKLAKKADEDCLCDNMTPEQQAEGEICDSCKAGGVLNTCSEIMGEVAGELFKTPTEAPEIRGNTKE